VNQGTQLSVWAQSYATSQPLDSVHAGRLLGQGTSPAPWCQSHIGGRAPAWNVTVQNQNQSHFCSPTPIPPLTTLSSSKESWEEAIVGRWTDGQAPAAALARGSGWLATGLCAGTVPVRTVSLAQEGILKVSSHLFLLRLRGVGVQGHG
jgi:hypothetical protein